MTKTFCDKCGDEITGFQATNIVTTNVATQQEQTGEILFSGHLCTQCQNMLKAWFQSILARSEI